MLLCGKSYSCLYHLILESYVQAEAAGSCHRIDLTVDAAQHFGCEAVIAGEIGQVVAGEVDSQILHGYLLHPDPAPGRHLQSYRYILLLQYPS